jgi:hypothetical protein
MENRLIECIDGVISSTCSVVEDSVNMTCDDTEKCIRALYGIASIEDYIAAFSYDYEAYRNTFLNHFLSIIHTLTDDDILLILGRPRSDLSDEDLQLAMQL